MTTRKKPGHRDGALKKRSRATASPVGELLLEIGVEELPYQFIVPALSALKDSAERLFNDQRLTFQSVRTMGTPRRLAIVVEGLAAKQTSMTKEAMGPSKAVAFDQAGQPTKAAVGFATGQGVAVQDLQIRRTPKGDYLFAVKREEGRPTAVVLMDTLPHLVVGLAFPKAMKWNDTGVRFARPIRWIVALYGGKVLPVEAAGIIASNQTKGHRVLGDGKWVSVRDAASYLKTLERQGVFADPQHRRTLIKEQITAICHKTGFQLNEDEALLDQAVYSTELPYSVMGSFKDAYLNVPEEILMTSMKEHQGFFSVRQKHAGKLAAKFIAVTNNGVKDMSLIREGNERVLAARLADAQFFFDEDRKVTLESRAKKLTGVMFHQKIGTMARKQERVGALVDAIAEQMGLAQESRSSCIAAAHLCKADLLSGIVGEFPELQGVMGGYYAQHDGLSPNLCKAIRDQYTPRGMDGALPETIEGRALGLADRIDTVVAFFQAGIFPKGSEDPFALRRHALSIIRIVIEGQVKLDLAKAINTAVELVTKDVKDVSSSHHAGPLEFIVERFRYYMGVTGELRDDVIQAATGYETQECDMVDLAGRMEALQAMTALPEFDPLMVGFNRANNILKKENAKSMTVTAVDPSLFQDDAERALYAQVNSTKERYDECLSMWRYKDALHGLVQLKPSIDRFFERVMVNAEDPAIRANRLSLLRQVVEDLFGRFADFSRIVVQGR